MASKVRLNFDVVKVNINCIDRRHDKSSTLRIKWLEMCESIAGNHPELTEELIGLFKERLGDPDEKVRAMVCKVFRQIERDDDIRSLDKALLESIAERIRDKKVLPGSYDFRHPLLIHT